MLVQDGGGQSILASSSWKFELATRQSYRTTVTAPLGLYRVDTRLIGDNFFLKLSGGSRVVGTLLIFDDQ